MRVATYNVEWFTGLFDEEGQLLDDDAWSARHNVTRAQQTAALGAVFRALDADAVMVIEAPDHGRSHSTVAALTTFATRFSLRTRAVALGFANDTQQEIALLYDPDVLQVDHAPFGPVAPADGLSGAPRFDGALLIDLDIDAAEDKVVFSKPPLELDMRTKNGFAFHMIGAHLKSKAPHGARNKADALRISIANRRKQLAQSIWLRRRISERLAQGVPLMLLGDLNDGPGLDEFESLFGRSSVEIILGADQDHALFDPHAKQALSRRLGAAPTTSRFWIKPEQRYLQALLDYIMVSQRIRNMAPRWRIWHPFDDPECWHSADLREALIAASDHYPVTLDFDDTV